MKAIWGWAFAYNITGVETWSNPSFHDKFMPAINVSSEELYPTGKVNFYPTLNPFGESWDVRNGIKGYTALMNSKRLADRGSEYHPKFAPFNGVQLWIHAGQKRHQSKRLDNPIL
eukprot:COSAG05_NODE_6806_length_899_cov_2.982500_1_plen_114_part_10